MAETLNVFLSLFGYLIIGFALFKLIQIANEMDEIKQVLKDIRRNTGAPSSAPTVPHSAESLVRAIHSGNYSDLVDDQPQPTHSEPQR